MSDGDKKDRREKRESRAGEKWGESEFVTEVGRTQRSAAQGTHTLPTRRRTRAGLVPEQTRLLMEVHLSQCSSKPSEDTMWKVRRDGLHPQSYCPLLRSKGQIPSKEGRVMCLKWG